MGLHISISLIFFWLNFISVSLDIKKPYIYAGLLYIFGNLTTCAKENLAPRPGLEPGTHGLTVGRCEKRPP